MYRYLKELANLTVGVICPELQMMTNCLLLTAVELEQKPDVAQKGAKYLWSRHASHLENSR